MKIKYYRLSKEERKEYKKKFFNTERGKNIKKYTNISLFISIFLLIYCIYLSLDTYLNHHSKYYYAYSALLLVISIIMIIANHRLKVKAVNMYIVKK